MEEALRTPNERRTGLRERRDPPAMPLERMSTKQRGLLAAKKVLCGTLIEAQAAREFGVQREIVHYYKEQLVRQGFSPVPPEVSPSDDYASAEAVRTASTGSTHSDAWEDYVNAYIMAGKLCEKKEGPDTSCRTRVTEVWSPRLTINRNACRPEERRAT